jgi:hypothetical protein
MNVPATKTRVRRGAAFLDKKIPNWFKIVKLSKLNQSLGYQPDKNHCGCVLAQLSPYGEYREGTEMVGLDVSKKRQEDLGFWGVSDDDDEYEALTEDWKDEIRKRRGK